MISFATYVATYLNKWNPATKMYWQVKDIPGDQKVIAVYLAFAQEVNLKHVETYKVPMTDAQYIAAWSEFADRCAVDAYQKGKR